MELSTLDMPVCRCKRHGSDERGYVSSRGPRIVAAALLGAAATGLLVGSLAFSPSSRGAEPQVTLQIAPRAPSAAGAVSVTSDTPGVELYLPNEGQSVSACTDKSTEESSCHWSFPRARSSADCHDGNTGYTFAGWSTPDCPDAGSCTLTLDDDYTSVAALFNPLLLGVRFSQGTGDPPPDRRVRSDPSGHRLHAVGRRSDRREQSRLHTPVSTEHAGAPHRRRSRLHQVERRGERRLLRTRERDVLHDLGGRLHVVGRGDLRQRAAAESGDDDQCPVPGPGRAATEAAASPPTNSIAARSARRSTSTAGESRLQPSGAQGSAFGGWNGVCSRMQTTCTFSVGPLTGSGRCSRTQRAQHADGPQGHQGDAVERRDRLDGLD